MSPKSVEQFVVRETYIEANCVGVSIRAKEIIEIETPTV